MTTAAISRRGFFDRLSILFRRMPSMAGIRFSTLGSGRRRHYIWIHGNEKTAREVLTSHMELADGVAFLTPAAERNVPILGGQIDPNRMFSRAGAEVNLRSLNPAWTGRTLNQALAMLDRDREGFLRRLIPPQPRLLVALHNNGPNYSIADETSISDAVSMNRRENPDEFFLCTARTDFDLLAKSPFNVALQANPSGPDDGSLSRLMAARGRRYVNIEAAHENMAAQKEMLEWLERELP